MLDSHLKLSQFVDQSDELIGGVFRATEDLDPLHRHLLYILLLGRRTFLPMGFDKEAVLKEISSTVGLERWSQIKKCSQHLQLLLDDFKDVKYTAASYWSPIDLRRRSVIHRPPVQKQDLANAFAFYALTFAGVAEPHGRELYSLTQYTSLRAPQKRGIITCFAEKLPDQDGIPWLHIPPVLHDLLLENLGISQHVEDALIRPAGLVSSKLEKALYEFFMTGDAIHEDFELSSFGTATISLFREHLDSVNGDLRTAIENESIKLSAFFNDPGIDFKQAAFMLATQLLWRKACQATYMYTFPTYVNKTCCVLTMGTDAPLGTPDMLAISSMARSLFIHPLLLDYSINEARAEATRRNNVFRRFLGHNLPKIIISPVTVELERINVALTEADPAIHEALSAANRLESLFEHYENLLIAFMPSERREGFFTGAVEEFDFHEDVWPKIVTAFELMRARILSSNLRESLQLQINAARPCRMIGHRTFVTEILFNLISNAVDAIHPIKARTDKNRATIEVDILLPGSDKTVRSASIRVRDRGEGFLPEELNKHIDAIETLAGTTRENFWTVIDSFLEQGVDSAAREEHMGMGIALSTAYLKSLEWQPDINAAGILSLQSVQGEGTTVTMTIPIGGMNALR